MASFGKVTGTTFAASFGTVTGTTLMASFGRVTGKPFMASLESMLSMLYEGLLTVTVGLPPLVPLHCTPMLIHVYDSQHTPVLK